MKLKNFSFPDALFLTLTLTSLVLGTILIFLNLFIYHFPSIPLFTPSFAYKSVLFYLSLSILTPVMFCYGIYAQKESPRGATFIWGLGALVIAYYANVVLVNGIATTPFPPIDHVLLKIDLLLGVNTPALMTWTHKHPQILQIFNWAYDALVFELLIIPIVLAALNARFRLRMFLNAQLLTLIIGSMIYYFFPTTAPSGIIHSPFFTTLQRDTSLRFYEIHHFLAVTTTQGGLVAFPSFHVIWAILLTHCTIKRGWIFYPILALNVVVIISTVVLGWHYLTDVIAGAILAFLGIYFAKWCEAKRFQKI